MRFEDAAPFQQLLFREEDRLQGITNRLFAFEAFIDELKRVTHDKEFRIRNGVVWMAMFDSRDMHVIHFSSWGTAFCSRTGFLGQVRDQHLINLSKHRRVDPALVGDPFVEDLHDETHVETFESLFPNAQGDSPTTDDVETLRTRFEAKLAPCVVDRNRNRAHAYEVPATSRAKMLGIADLRELTDFAEKILNSFSNIGARSELGYEDLNDPSGWAAAIEIVDSILFGSVEECRGLMGRDGRDAFYERLHARHDRLDGEVTLLFNEREFVGPPP